MKESLFIFRQAAVISAWSFTFLFCVTGNSPAHAILEKQHLFESAGSLTFGCHKNNR
ncbi:hypothetical protein [Halobacillus litoralis]|uniref:hypothetical protein n=1 Tax=Halobacillus litoralis TaxID=45668 RepID=UPI00136AF173|nr:hypothetical protein [Halobacillus litoralis]